MTDIKSIVVERDINPYHSFLSSFFAGFAELGMINQGSMNIVSKRAAEYLYSFLEAKDFLSKLEKFEKPNGIESIKYHVGYVNQMLNLMGKYELKVKEQDEFTLQISGNLCRICPKGVGGAAIKGSFCPIPTFIEELVNLMVGQEAIDLQTNGIEKEGVNCIATYKFI